MTKAPVYSFPVYVKTNDDEGSVYLCSVRENGRTFLVFWGETAEGARQAAIEWANANLRTPERLERIAKANAERVAKRAKKDKGCKEGIAA